MADHYGKRQVKEAQSWEAGKLEGLKAFEFPDFSAFWLPSFLASKASSFPANMLKINWIQITTDVHRSKKYHENAKGLKHEKEKIFLCIKKLKFFGKEAQPLLLCFLDFTLL